MFCVSIGTVHISLNFWSIILNCATTCVRQLEFVHMNLGEGGRWSRYFAFTNSPHCNRMDVCSRCSLIHCGLQPLCPLGPDPGSRWYQWQSFHWFWRCWIVPFMAFNIRVLKDPVLILHFSLCGVLYFTCLLLSWNSFRKCNQTFQLSENPCTRGSFSCFALWHQYMCSPNYYVSWIEHRFCSTKLKRWELEQAEGWCHVFRTSVLVCSHLF